MSAHKMIAILFSLFLMGISGTVCAQTFSSLPESERNAKLIEVAKYVRIPNGKISIENMALLR